MRDARERGITAHFSRTLTQGGGADQADVPHCSHRRN